MGKMLTLRKVSPGDLILKGYGKDEQLLISDFRVDSSEDLEKLKNMGVRRCMIRVESETSEEPSPEQQDIPASEVRQEDLDEISNQIEQTSRLYNQTEEQLDGVFQSVQDGSLERAEVDALKPSVEQFVHFAEHSRASISALTQLESYDDYTLNHSLNVCLLGLLYGLEEGMDRALLEQLGFGALVHDIGKTRLPRSIINKPGGLNDEEWKKIRQHPDLGAELLTELGYEEEVITIARQHHERPNGNGYPDGISQLDPLARIISVCDVYEALTGQRSYREPENPVAAYKTLREEFGSFQSTQPIVNQLIRCLGLFPVGSMVRLTNGDLAVVKKNDPDHLNYPIVLIIDNETGSKLDDPYKVDLFRVQKNKQVHRGELYDDDVEIKSVIRPSQMPDIAPELERILGEGT